MSCDFDRCARSSTPARRLRGRARRTPLRRWPEFFTDDGRYKVQARENFDRGLPLR